MKRPTHVLYKQNGCIESCFLNLHTILNMICPHSRRINSTLDWRNNSEKLTMTMITIRCLWLGRAYCVKTNDRLFYYASLKWPASSRWLMVDIASQAEMKRTRIQIMTPNVWRSKPNNPATVLVCLVSYIEMVCTCASLHQLTFQHLMFSSIVQRSNWARE